ncbi:MAG: hypothetical protein QOK26_1961, partial [Pseudonocardiales bacterium]|nr:hypothetical protein [Pseudonocardiales bacterium]
MCGTAMPLERAGSLMRAPLDRREGRLGPATYVQ